MYKQESSMYIITLAYNETHYPKFMLVFLQPFLHFNEGVKYWIKSEYGIDFYSLLQFCLFNKMCLVWILRHWNSISQQRRGLNPSVLYTDTDEPVIMSSSHDYLYKIIHTITVLQCFLNEYEHYKLINVFTSTREIQLVKVHKLLLVKFVSYFDNLPILNVFSSCLSLENIIRQSFPVSASNSCDTCTEPMFELHCAALVTLG